MRVIWNQKSTLPAFEDVKRSLVLDDLECSSNQLRPYQVSLSIDKKRLAIIKMYIVEFTELIWGV